MEEQVGALWHRLITRAARRGYPDAAVRLADIQGRLGILFRALGGDGALAIEAAEATEYGGPRAWLERVAGLGDRITLAWRDERALRLPPVIDWLPTASLNRDLYIWLAALAAVPETEAGDDWFRASQRRSLAALHAFPGLRPRYDRLVAAHLRERTPPQRLPRSEQAAERIIRRALLRPGSQDRLPAGRAAPQPVVLWLHPSPPLATASTGPEPADDDASQRDRARALEDARRRRAERVDEPESDRGLVTIRMENIFSWGEYVRVDRGAEDNDDLDQAESVAQDIDRVSVTRSGNTRAARLKFDLDLPGEANDDPVTGAGCRLPEWDWRKGRLIPDHCRVLPLVSRDAGPAELPDHLRPLARRLKRQFQALAPARTWLRAQPDGPELDLDAYQRFAADRRSGHGAPGNGLYRDLREGARDLSCLLMADLSLSTDTWINDHQRVIDVIRDSLFLFSESLAATGDPFAVYGFSSRRRDPVRVHLIKHFDERYGARIRGRIQAIRPGYYTRMGAAVRYGQRLLAARGTDRRLLLMLTDGKPNDLDAYEGRYGIEDTRRALQEARRAGLRPFCVTIDEKGNDYLPYLFGSNDYLVIRRPEQLPSELPRLYARLTL